MGKPITTANRQGYRAVAAAVLASAVRDLTPAYGQAETDGTVRPKALNRQTAQRFFRSPASPRLALWCAWLELAPDRVCAVMETITE